MKALVTGMHSVLGGPIRRVLDEHGIELVAWDRGQVSPDDPAAVERFFGQVQPDLVFHFALGAMTWAQQLAGLSRANKAVMVFTSTVSVFAGQQVGPFTPERVPEPDDDYGRYKRDCERMILQANPEARVARIGWQIGHAPGSNNMVDYLENTFQQQGRIPASVNWRQACSFVEDTVDGLFSLSQGYAGGVYHLDANPGLNFYQIVQGLNGLHGERWEVEPAQEPRLDNRLLDERIRLRPLTAHFVK